MNDEVLFILEYLIHHAKWEGDKFALPNGSVWDKAEVLKYIQNLKVGE